MLKIILSGIVTIYLVNILGYECDSWYDGKVHSSWF